MLRGIRGYEALIVSEVSFCDSFGAGFIGIDFNAKDERSRREEDLVLSKLEQ